jgi:2-polyprenyl-3-methyl-5-hydroxy-6-metoxy-1,4-benzoquinol methylase
MGPSEIKEFYDRFSSDVLLDDFQRLNLRQEAVKALCSEFVPRGARVLEIGCGVGINAKHVLKRASRFVGVDLSERSIEVAREYAASPKAEFRVLDVVERGEELVSLGPFDVVVLPDVIEHIPKNRYAGLFAVIERVLARPGWVLLTYPSPEYQRYLRENEPAALQIVDEVVAVEEILGRTALELVLFRYRNIWHKHQYVHVVLTTDRSYEPGELARTPAQRLAYRLKKRWWRIRNRGFVRQIARREAPTSGKT